MWIELNTRMALLFAVGLGSENHIKLLDKVTEDLDKQDNEDFISMHIKAISL